MIKKLSFILVCGLFFAAAVSAQEAQKEKKTLKNADIVMMVQNHFDDDTLLKIIEVSDTDFDISGDALIALALRCMCTAPSFTELDRCCYG